MKKHIVTMLGFGCVCGIAQAQSSVTLYGLLDAGVLYNSNSGGQRLYKMASGNFNGDRWGMRGSEDLGDGLAVIFKLESGYDITNGTLGQGGALFGREATVGLTNKFGDVTIGRQYDTFTNYIGGYASGDWTASGAAVGSWGTVYGVHPADMDNLGGSKRTNNSIKFKSDNFYGFTAGGFYSLGGVAGNFSQNQIYSFGVSYAMGPFKFAAAYLNQRDPNYSYYGNQPNSNTVTSASALNMTSPVDSGFASAHTQQNIGVGASYESGPITLGAEYSNVQFRNLGAEKGAGLNPLGLTGEAVFNIAEVSAAYRIVPAFEVGVAYIRTMGSSVGRVTGATYNQLNVGLDYKLSKLTDVYLVGVFERASGIDSTGKTAVANLSGLSPSSNSTQAVAVTGIRHRF